MGKNYCSITTIIIFTVFLAVAPANAGDPISNSKKNIYRANHQLSGGNGHDFTLEQVRWGDHRSFERVVLEFNNRIGDPSPLPAMKIETEYYPSRIAMRITGVERAVEGHEISADQFSESNLLSGLNIYDTCEGGLYLDIVPARPIEYEIFTLVNPPRLIIDVQLSRMGPLPETERYSVRTFPLFGDQVCILLKEAADSGITPRLLTDREGKVFGELGLFDTAADALTEKERLRALFAGRFAIVVKGRGYMETPAVLP
jgi:hypothetical protein